MVVAIVVSVPGSIKQHASFIRHCLSSQISLLDFNHRAKSVAKIIPANNEPTVNPAVNTLHFLGQKTLLLPSVCLELYTHILLNCCGNQRIQANRQSTCLFCRAILHLHPHHIHRSEATFPFHLI